MYRYKLHSSKNLPNEKPPLDRMRKRREKQRRYYPNMSVDKKKKIRRHRKQKSSCERESNDY